MNLSNHVYPLPGFRFSITLEKIFELPNSSFMEAYGFGAQIQLEEVQSGGQNGYKYQLPGNSTFSNLVLKQGILPVDSPLEKWCMKTILYGASEGIEPLPLTLHLMNDQGKPARSWSFTEAYPVKYQTSEFKSTDNSVAVETVEFAYKYFKSL